MSELPKAPPGWEFPVGVTIVTYYSRGVESFWVWLVQTDPKNARYALDSRGREYRFASREAAAKAFGSLPIYIWLDSPSHRSGKLVRIRNQRDLEPFHNSAAYRAFWAPGGEGRKRT
ncbi:MAG TPA: hypothetical protein VKQ30_10030 [Ktedonobacterales bacterium]|nr:hypothetical protein [Ktedonobacterales bacterium]